MRGVLVLVCPSAPSGTARTLPPITVMNARRFISRRSLDDLVRPDEYRLRDRETECLGGPQIDDQIEFRGLLDRQIAGLGTFEHFVDVKGQALVKRWLVRPIGHEAA